MYSMFRCFAIVLLALTMFTPLIAQKKVAASGSILGSDGNALPKSHALLTRLQWGDAQEHKYVIEADKNGKWMMRVYPGLYRIEFTGVNHRRTEAVYANIEEGVENTFSARLGVNPYYSEEEIDTVFILFADPSSFGRSSKPMTALGNGRYAATLPCDPLTGTVSYHISQIMPQRNINGTQSALYIYDGDGDYMSCVDCPGDANDVEIILDLALLPDHSRPEAALELVQGAPLQHPLAKGAAALFAQIDWNRTTSQENFEAYNALNDTIASGSDGKPWRQPRDVASRSWTYMFVGMTGVHYYIDTTAVKELEKGWRAQYRNAFETKRTAFESAVRSGTPEDKVFAAAVLAEAALSVKRDSSHDYAALLSRVFETVPPESPVWSMTQGFTLASKLPDPERRAYLQGLIWRQRSTDVRLGAYRAYFLLLRRSGNEADSLRLMTLLDSAMSVCTDGSCGSEAVIEAALGSKGMKAWRMKRLKEGSEQAQRYYDHLLPDELAGKAMPPFSLITVDSVRTALSSEDLRGKPYILVLFKASMIGTSHGVDAAIEASRMYSKQGLRSLMCYEVPDNPSLDRYTKYLEHPIYRMGEGRDALLMLNEKYADVAYVSMLVDSDGIIRASNQRLSDEVLFFTLRDFFGEK